MRVMPLARRLGGAALVLTLGVGLSSCSSDSSSDSSSSASDDSTASATTGASDTTTEPVDEESAAPEVASLAELSADDFYPSVMAAMRKAETFTFETVSDSAGASQTMSGQARFGDAGVEMKASSTGAQPMELIRRQVAEDRPE